MGVSIPQPFDSHVSGSLGSVGPVTVAGIPDTFHINIDHLPKIQLGVDPLTINPVTLHLDPIDLNMSIKEIPNIRASMLTALGNAVPQLKVHIHGALNVGC